MQGTGRLTSTRASSLLARKPFLLGAAIGTGMAARAASRGGADFLLALSAGRFRSMGVPSAACMLALRDSNEVVMEFGSSELLGCTALPVFFGATTLGSREAIPDLVGRIVAAGFHGIANFPTCIFLDGQYRTFLEEGGMGLSAEIALLSAARQFGLATLGYVHTVEEARRMAAAGVDLINLDFGWNAGGWVGVNSALDIDETSDAATLLVNEVRAIAPRTRCLIEGGPIVIPEQMDEVCRRSGADGYIGGSTIDRLPLENAIEMATAAFKAIGSVRREVVTLQRELSGTAPLDVLLGRNENMIRARDQVARAAENDLVPVLIVGEPGTGRGEVAKLIHDSGIRRARKLIVVTCGSELAHELEFNLFGCEAGAFPGITKTRVGWLELAHESTLVLCDVENLPLVTQRQLVQTIESGTFWRRGSAEAMTFDVRLIGLSSVDPTDPAHAASFDAEFLQRLGTVRIVLPPLREHLEDLPLLTQHILGSQPAHSKPRLDPTAFRVLVNYDWPRNIRELRAVLLKASPTAGSDIVYARDLPNLVQATHTAAPERSSFPSERDWILDALQRHRYRRAETARFLGLSRKTLYNKMSTYGLVPEQVSRSRKGR
jgi:predicted TIM-barrel enzyme/DNA-binding NtrC family response regulator